MTAAVRANFTKFSEQTGYLDFTRENVFQLLSMVLDNTGNILEVAIGQLFDKFTQYHHENRCHVGGLENQFPLQGEPQADFTQLGRVLASTATTSASTTAIVKCMTT